MDGLTYPCVSAAAALSQALVAVTCTVGLAGWLVISPAIAANTDDAYKPIGVDDPAFGRPDPPSYLFGKSARQTADSDPASFKPGDTEVSDKAEAMRQSTYCDKPTAGAGLAWFAASLLSSWGSSSNNEPMRCP